MRRPERQRDRILWQAGPKRSQGARSFSGGTVLSVMVKMAPASPKRIPLIFDSLSCSNKVTALYSGRLPMATRIAVCHRLVAYRSYSGGSWCSYDGTVFRLEFRREAETAAFVGTFGGRLFRPDDQISH